MPIVVPALVFLGLLAHILLNLLVLEKLEYGVSLFSFFDVLGVFCGIFVTDFLTCFFHWLGDCSIEWKNPLLKKFHELSGLHHKRPLEILEKKYYHIKGNIAFLYAPPLILAYFCAEVKILSPLVFMLVTVSNLMLLAHTIHKWCHQKPAGGFKGFLQKHSVIVSPQYHMQHHKPPYLQNFAGINGWSETFFSRLTLKWRGN